MNGPECPVEGCEYNEDGEKNKKSVRRHINAKTDDAHEDKQALRAALMGVDEGGDSDDDPPGTGGATATDEDEDDEQGEAVVEGAESSTESENEHPEEGGEMDQSKEYDEQLQQATNEGTKETSEESDGDGQNQQSDDQPDASSSGPSGLAILVGTVVLGLAVLLATSGDNSDEQEPIEVESETADPVKDGVEPDEVWG